MGGKGWGDKGWVIRGGVKWDGLKRGVRVCERVCVGRL